MQSKAAIQIDHAQNPRHFRDALGQFATGVAVVTTCTASGKREGVTINSFAGLSLGPPLVLWSLRFEAQSFDSFASSDCFAVNVLAAEQQWISRHFAQPAVDKFAGIPSRDGLGGCPVIDASLAVFECVVEQRIETGDHMLFIGRVEEFQTSKGTPLIFSRGNYCSPVAIVAPEIPAVTGGLES